LRKSPWAIQNPFAEAFAAARGFCRPACARTAAHCEVYAPPAAAAPAARRFGWRPARRRGVRCPVRVVAAEPIARRALYAERAVGGAGRTAFGARGRPLDMRAVRATGPRRQPARGAACVARLAFSPPGVTTHGRADRFARPVPRRRRPRAGLTHVLGRGTRTRGSRDRVAGGRRDGHPRWVLRLGMNSTPNL